MREGTELPWLRTPLLCSSRSSVTYSLHVSLPAEVWPLLSPLTVPPRDSSIMFCWHLAPVFYGVAGLLHQAESCMWQQLLIVLRKGFECWGVKGIVLNVRVTAKGFCFQFLSLFLSLPNLEKNPKNWGKYAVEYYSALKNEVILSCDHMDEPRGHHAPGG